MTAGLVGFRPLLRVTAEQDRFSILPWIALISALSASSVLLFGFVFPDERSSAEFALAVGANPALSIVFGRAHDLSTADGFNAWRAGALGTFFAGLMAILIVVRNSRAQEDSGQAELIASGVLGRQARLAVAVGLAAAASLALGVVAGLLTILLGGGVANSFMLSATYAASGLMFAGVGAVAAQLGSEARTANTMAVGTLGVLYVARGYVDASGAGDWAAWLTPLGWLQEARPATENNWWALLPAVGLGLLLVALALRLHARRDFGMGVVGPRPGPARAGGVGTVQGLALRLQRGGIISWMMGFLALGVVWGTLLTTLGDVLRENPDIAQFLAAGVVAEADLASEFVHTIIRLLGVIAAVHGVQVVMRLHAEEAEHRVEPLLAGALSRGRLLGSHAVVAFVSTAVAMTVGGATMGVVAAAADPSISAADVLQQALATIPAVWVLCALALAAVGARPSKRVVAWFGVVGTFALTLLGPMFRLDDWVLGISPLWHVPNVNVPAPDWSGLAWLGLVAALLTAVGFAGFRRRDVM